MSEYEKLEWLKAYERQNPSKYLQKYGKVKEKDFNGQPIAWDYIPPEEAVILLRPSMSSGKVLGVEVDVKPKDKVVVEQDFVDPISGVGTETSAEPQPKPKKGRKSAENV